MQNNSKQWVDKSTGNTNSVEKETDFYTIEKQTSKRAIMLDIEFENGNCIALPYAYLSKIKYDPSDGIIIVWGGTHIKIEGRNLRKLYTQVTRHRVINLYESIGEIDEGIEDLLFIDKISIVNEF